VWLRRRRGVKYVIPDNGVIKVALPEVKTARILEISEKFE